jgi:hypothetical protein
MHDGRPVYRLQSGNDWRTVYGDTGALLTGMSADEAMALMRRFIPEHSGTLRYEGRLLDSDQWTLQNVIRNNMPMHLIALGDTEGTEYYVSEKTGEPVLRTTASGRFWGYMGAVLHWRISHRCAGTPPSGTTSWSGRRSSAPSCARWGS